MRVYMMLVFHQKLYCLGISNAAMNAKTMLGHAGVHPASSKPILHHP